MQDHPHSSSVEAANPEAAETVRGTLLPLEIATRILTTDRDARRLFALYPALDPDHLRDAVARAEQLGLTGVAAKTGRQPRPFGPINQEP